MVDDDKNKSSDPDFDDDIFDENLDDADFDDADYEVIEDDAAGYEDADFSEDDVDWDEEDQQPAAGKKAKKEKSLYTSGDKKSFMSFNAMVITGTILVGGAVGLYTIFSQGAQVAAGKKTIFQSALNIGEFMDGGIFGKDPANAPPEAVPGTEQPLPTPDAPEEEAQPDLLVNPELTPNIQPSPITAETEPLDVLTPMPGDAELPRGPEEYASDPGAPTRVEPVTPEPAPALTAEDILKGGIAKRQEKIDAVTPEPVALEIQDAPAPIAATEPEPQPEPVETPVAPLPPLQPEDIATSKAEVKAKEDEIASLQKTIASLQTQLGDAQKNSGEEKTRLQKSVRDLEEALRKEKARPTTVVAAAKSEPVEEEVPAPVKVKASPAVRAPVQQPKAVSKPAPVKAAASQASTRWELRAAQPGKAWVSKPGQRDMQGVQVGESLPGIGRITAITYQNGRWAVLGTQGQVLQ